MQDKDSVSSIEAARKLFAGACDFIAGAPTEAAMPAPTLPEVAFAGRSNVGKSSLVNALTGRKTLARVSHTPGRTQQINFFNLGGRLILSDLPGYGYAEVSKAQKAEWGKLIRDYLSGRVTLQAVCLLIDGRHGLKAVDEDILDLLDSAAVSTRIILTKADKAKDLETTIEAVTARLKKHTAAYPEVFVTSSHAGQGIEDLRSMLAGFAAS
jgi:GTP-binding protein